MCQTTLGKLGMAETVHVKPMWFKFVKHRFVGVHTICKCYSKFVKMAMNLKEFDVSELEDDGNATVHEVVLEVSPVKVSRNNPEVKYFSGKISDGKKVARMISFEISVREVKKRREVCGVNNLSSLCSAVSISLISV